MRSTAGSVAWRTTWTKHKVLLGWFRSSPGHLISLPPAVGAVQRRVGPGLQQCCPLIVTGLRHPILLVTGLSYLRGACARPRPRAVWAIFPEARPCSTEVAKPPGRWPRLGSVLLFPRAAAPSPDTNPFSPCPGAGTAQYGRVLPGTSTP